jgi:hypothetical protein
LKSLLFGVSATDPLTFGVIASVLIGLLYCFVLPGATRDEGGSDCGIEK